MLRTAQQKPAPPKIIVPKPPTSQTSSKPKVMNSDWWRIMFLSLRGVGPAASVYMRER